MTTSLDTLVVPVRYYTALDPYNWKVDNRPISDLEDNDDVLRSGIETTLNAIKVGATVDGRILRSLVGLDKASGDWATGPGISLIVNNAIMVVEKPDDGYLAVDVIATQYSQQVFTFSAPTAGYKKLITISAGFNLPLPANMPYFDSTQSLDAVMVDFTTAQTKQGTMDYEVITSIVALSDPDTYLDPSLGNKKLFQIKVLDTDTSLTIGSIDPVGITKHGQAVAKATNTTYGQVRFATGTEVTTGTSTDTVVSPADLATRALLEGDPAVNFQVEDAVDPKDAVNLFTLKNLISFRNFPVLVLQLAGDATYEIPPGGRIRVQLIGGGGGGGSCTEEGAFTQNSTGGGDTYIYNETTLEVYVNARGGERGRNGDRWGDESYASFDALYGSPSNFPTEFPLDDIKPSLEVIASAMGSKHISASSTYRQFHSDSYSRGGGGSPRPPETNLGTSSYGMAGSLVDTFLSNTTSSPLPIKITIGSAGQKSITYWGEGTDGQPGFATLMIYAS